jgi:hypothetical protein
MVGVWFFSPNKEARTKVIVSFRVLAWQLNYFSKFSAISKTIN